MLLHQSSLGLVRGAHPTPDCPAQTCRVRTAHQKAA
nr:MAG TPA: 14-3-3 protein zeta/delta [Inoviridae sp.]